MIAASLRCPTSTGCELGRGGGNAAQATLDMPSLYGWDRTENGRADQLARTCGLASFTRWTVHFSVRIVSGWAALTTARSSSSETAWAPWPRIVQASEARAAARWR